MKLSRHDVQKLEDYWRNIEDYKTRLRHRERDLIEGWIETDTNQGGGKANHISDQTGNKAAILADDAYYQTLKRIVHTIETMYPKLTHRQKTIVDMKYFEKTDCYVWQDVAKELNISVQQVLKIRNNLIDETAIRLGFA